MLDLVRTALRRATKAYDAEIQLLIDDCLLELKGLGIIDSIDVAQDQQVQTAVVCYCKWKFGDNPDADRWERIYHDKVAKLMSMSGYGLSGGGSCG